jgi:hypothetical protein
LCLNFVLQSTLNMENLFGPSSWEEDLLFIGTFVFMIVGFILLCYAFGVTLMAMCGKYSIPAVVFYWTVVAVAILFCWYGEVFTAFMFYVWLSPLVMPIMLLLERDRKRNLERNG